MLQEEIEIIKYGEQNMKNEYQGAKIINIRRGKGHRSEIVYAQIVSSTGELLINATLDYCVQTLKERLK